MPATPYDCRAMHFEGLSALLGKITSHFEDLWLRKKSAGKYSSLRNSFPSGFSAVTRNVNARTRENSRAMIERVLRTLPRDIQGDGGKFCSTTTESGP